MNQLLLAGIVSVSGLFAIWSVAWALIQYVNRREAEQILEVHTRR